MSTGQINATELAASLICSEKTIPEGIRHLQDVVDGSMTLLAADERRYLRCPR